MSEASTTRLSAVTFYLVGKYQWPIEARDKAAGCRDGRVAWVAEYLLSPEVITQAMAAGAGDWCAKVRAARLARRAHAAQARSDADRANAARNTRRQHPGQWGLFAQDGLLAMKHCETLAKALPHDEQREFLAELPTMTGRTRHELLALLKGDLMHRTREAKCRGAKP